MLIKRLAGWKLIGCYRPGLAYTWHVHTPVHTSRSLQPQRDTGLVEPRLPPGSSILLFLLTWNSHPVVLYFNLITWFLARWQAPVVFVTRWNGEGSGGDCRLETREVDGPESRLISRSSEFEVEFRRNRQERRSATDLENSSHVVQRLLFQDSKLTCRTMT